MQNIASGNIVEFPRNLFLRLLTNFYYYERYHQTADDRKKFWFYWSGRWIKRRIFSCHRP